MIFLSIILSDLLFTFLSRTSPQMPSYDILLIFSYKIFMTFHKYNIVKN